MTRPRVVVVGLGDTGVLTAIALRGHADVVGISPTPQFVSGQELGLRLARPRAWERDYRIDYSRFRGLDRARLVHGSARTPAALSSRFSPRVYPRYATRATPIATSVPTNRLRAGV